MIQWMERRGLMRRPSPSAASTTSNRRFHSIPDAARKHHCSHALYCATCTNFTSGGHLMLPEHHQPQSSEKYKRRRHDVSAPACLSFLPPLMFAKCAWHLPQICFANASAPLRSGKSTDFTTCLRKGKMAWTLMIAHFWLGALPCIA